MKEWRTAGRSPSSLSPAEQPKPAVAVILERLIQRNGGHQGLYFTTHVLTWYHLTFL